VVFSKKWPMQKQMLNKKNIALVAHDNKKSELIQWVKKHKKSLLRHNLLATGTTGEVIEKELELKIKKFKSGPLGGDQQIGASIVNGKIDLLIFFWDPLASQPHDPDVKAVLRVAALWDTVIACNKSTADFVIKSFYINKPYHRHLESIKDYSKKRKLGYQNAQ
jgi:methylglyoxal synthase